jgi:hypothetical protein
MYLPIKYQSLSLEEYLLLIVREIRFILFEIVLKQARNTGHCLLVSSLDLFLVECYSMTGFICGNMKMIC